MGLSAGIGQVRPREKTTSSEDNLTSTEKPVLLVHLSDIHFKTGEFGEEERNTYLRGELERDLAAMRDRLGPATAVVVTGDVAFAGKPDEYTVARDWLNAVSEIVGAAPTSVLSVPGNHDVDWARIGVAGSALREKLRSCMTHEIDGLLDACLAEMDLSVMTPLAAYNDFATFCDCRIGQRLSWQTELPLPHGYRLVVRGVTTVVGSDRNDDAGSLVVGRNQLQFDIRDPSIVYAVLAHHDSYFWRDHQRLEELLSRRVALQMYGHTHAPRVQVIDDGVVVTAGATQPEEGADWCPTYNWIVLDVQPAHPPTLTIDIWTRRYRSGEFTGDSHRDEQSDRCTRTLPALVRTTAEIEEESVEESVDEARAVSQRPPLFQSGGQPDLSRRVLYALQPMGIGDRYQLFAALGLASPEDMTYSPTELLIEVMARAREAGKLEALANRLGLVSPDDR